MKRIVPAWSLWLALAFLAPFLAHFIDTIATGSFK